MDADRAQGRKKGPLHGLPILIKNNLATLDKMNTTAGSYALLGTKVPRDATVIAKLRAAGAIVLGKANMSQWAGQRGNGTDGWSAYGGQCQGVYYPGQNPSGSSSGSAVGTTLGLAAAALGSETFGSLVIPAQVSNIVAIKPTVGLTSRSLLIPVSPHQDTVGPMARSVKDAALVLQAIAGPDPLDNYTSAQPSSLPNYVNACNLNALSGARIGVPRNLIQARSGYDIAPFNAAIKSMQDAGATVVDDLKVSENALAFLRDAVWAKVIDTDFVSGLPSYLSQLTSNPNGIYSVYDLRNFTQHSYLEDYHQYPNVDTSKWDRGLAHGINNTSPEFWAEYQNNLDVGGRESFQGLLQNHSLDALVTPTVAAYNLAAVVGTPLITVPMGFNNDLGKSSMNNNPTAISFIGAKWSEEKLIGYAYAFEQKTKVRQNGPLPYLIPRTQLADVIHR